MSEYGCGFIFLCFCEMPCAPKNFKVCGDGVDPLSYLWLLVVKVEVVIDCCCWCWCALMVPWWLGGISVNSYYGRYVRYSLTCKVKFPFWLWFHVFLSVNLLRPTQEEMEYVRPCVCGLDPTLECELHPCQCIKCKKGFKMECGWRIKHLEFLKKRNVNIQLEAGTMQYVNIIDTEMIWISESVNLMLLKMSQCQIMSNVVKMSKCQMSRLSYKQKVTKDLNNGKKIFPNFRPCSSSPRERNLLNIMAFLNRPIEGSDLVIDLTQSIGWCQTAQMASCRRWPLRVECGFSRWRKRPTWEISWT